MQEKVAGEFGKLRLWKRSAVLPVLWVLFGSAGSMVSCTGIEVAGGDDEKRQGVWEIGTDHNHQR